MPRTVLDSSGVFSTTAAARQTLFDPLDYSGSYTGTWANDQGFNGPLTAVVQVSPAPHTAAMTIDFPDEFGPFMVNGSFGPNGLTANSGEGTLLIREDATMTLRTNLSDPTLLNGVTVTDQFDGTNVTGEFELFWPDSLPGPPLEGSWTLQKH